MSLRNRLNSLDRAAREELGRHCAGCGLPRPLISIARSEARMVAACSVCGRPTVAGLAIGADKKIYAGIDSRRVFAFGVAAEGK